MNRRRLLTTRHDYFVTHEAIRILCEKTGARERRISLYEEGAGAEIGAIVDRLLSGVGPATRVIGLTWVHSSTGVKLPMREIGDAIAEINEGRDDETRITLVLDAVHGFGVEDADFEDVGCDFYIAGCHKWLFGPRGAGIVASRDWSRLFETLPSFIDDETFLAWLENRAPSQSSSAARHTPGGFKAFEHVWSLPAAFAIHEETGRDRIAARTHELASRLKDGLADISRIRLVTPRAAALSAGIVSFDIEGMSAVAGVRRLRERDIMASAAPYAESHIRLTPSVRNSVAEIETALSALREFA